MSANMTAPSEKGFSIENAVVAGGETALGWWGLTKAITQSFSLAGVSPVVSMIALTLIFSRITIDGVKKTAALFQPRPA